MSKRDRQTKNLPLLSAMSAKVATEEPLSGLSGSVTNSVPNMKNKLSILVARRACGVDGRLDSLLDPTGTGSMVAFARSRLVQLHPATRLSIHRRRRCRLLLRLMVLGQWMLLQGFIQHTLLLHRRGGRSARRAGRRLQGTGVDRQRLKRIESLGHV